MVESPILYTQLCDADSKAETEQTLTRLIHATLEDDDIPVNYQKVEGINYARNWVDPGRFTIDAYTVRRTSDAWKINMAASYDDYLLDDQPDADFHAPINGHIVLQVTAQCGPDAFAGDASVFAFPETTTEGENVK